jgi:single-stranded-DNA-specific exonuclease
MTSILSPETQSALSKASGLTPLMVSMLWARGVTTAEAMRAACDPDVYRETPSDQLPDYQVALDRIVRAVRERQSIAIWGDFDVDGITSTAILLTVLRAAGAQVRFKIPSRLEEGHGISLEGAQQLASDGVQLMITVDTGITAHAACARLAELGVEVVITDHHALAETLPQSIAAVNPQRLPENHPLRTLSGAGVAFKLAQGLCEVCGLNMLLPALYGLCAVGLVADVVPLVADTRWLVQVGLEALRGSSAPWLQALAGVARFSASLMDEEDIAFRIAPRLNALGRLGDASVGVDFLTETDPTRAAEMARTIDSLNTQRQFLTQQVLAGAQQQIAARPDLLDYAALVLAGETWPAGVLGLVASQLVEKYGRPVLMITRDGEIARGSARSAGGVHLAQALTACQEMLLTFGGHEMAAGFSLPWPAVEDFRLDFSRHLRASSPTVGEALHAHTDGRLSLEQAVSEGWEAMERLRPFGQGFRRPVWLSPPVLLESSARFGRQQEHLRVHVQTAAGRKFELLAWRTQDMPPVGPAIIRYTVSADTRDGQRRAQLFVSEILPVEESVPESEVALGTAQRVIDLRHSADPTSAVQALLTQDPAWCVWSEGAESGGLSTADRTTVRATGRLVLWSAPPDARVLQQVLAAAQSDVVAVVLRDPATTTPEEVLRLVGGAARFALRQRDGVLPFEALARKSGHSEAAIEAAVSLLEQTGNVEAQAMGEGMLIQAINDTPNPIPSGHAGLLRLTRLLAEEAAYRRFLREGNPERFIP